MLTAEDAQTIADKLGIQPREKRNHVRVAVHVEGTYIGSYGISRGSKELPHDYIPKQIGITSREARDLSRCPLSRDGYIELLRQRGRLDSSS